MSILTRIKNALKPKSYPVTEFGIQPLEFFIALLRACPPGTRLTFDNSEPESFVHAFQRWSHRSDPKSFEADYYTVDAGLISLAETLAGRGELQLECHFGISSPDSRLLCASWDDFMVVKLADDIKQEISRQVA
jgi:hypothetical protein